MTQKKHVRRNSMSNRFMISVAALALFAGTGLANAQGTMNRDSGGAGAQPAQQQTQPSGGAAEHGATGKDTMTREKGTVGQAGGASTMKPGAAAEDKSSGAMKDEHSGAMNKNAAEDKASTTVGQAGAGAKLSTEQRTQITSVIREERVAPVTNVNFAISVGTRVPREGIELHALPSRVVTIYPEWRSYRYVLVREQIVIIVPNTYEIVAVLDV